MGLYGPLYAASPLPYRHGSPIPREMTRVDMDRVREDFVRATHMTEAAGFDYHLTKPVGIADLQAVLMPT